MSINSGKDRMEDVFGRIEALTPAYVALWERICSFETPSDNKAALDEQTRFLAAFARDRGFFVTEYPFPRAGDCLTAETRAGEPPKVALLAHLDTVHPVGSFGYPPVRREGSILRGPGHRLQGRGLRGADGGPGADGSGGSRPTHPHHIDHRRGGQRPVQRPGGHRLHPGPGPGR